MSDWFKAEFHAEQAHQFYEAGQWEKAVAELKIALAVNPLQAEWHLGMGLALDELDRYEESIASYQKVIELRGGDAETLMLLGVAQLRADQPQACIETLARANALDPNHEPGYCHRILAYAQLGKHEEAEEMFYMARQIVDHCSQCYDHMGHSLAAQGKFDRAIWCWQQALKHDPHYPDAYANLARAHWHKGQPQRAYSMFVQQLRQEPGDIDTLLEMGNLLIDLGRHAEAGEKFRRVLELDPAVAQAHLHLGELAILSGHLDAAQASLDMAGRIDADMGGVHLCLAQVAMRRNKTDKARAEIELELQKTDRSPHHTLDLARMLIELRNAAPVAGLLNPLIDDPLGQLLDDKRHASALLYRGVASLILGQVEAGIRDCRRALRYDKTLSLAMFNLALAYEQTGRHRHCRYWLARAARIKPEDPQLRKLQLRIVRQIVLVHLSQKRQAVGRFFRRVLGVFIPGLKP